MNFYQIGSEKAAGEYGLAPLAGTLGKALPIPFSGPLAAGLTAGAEGEGRDTNESMSRGLYAAGGNLAGSVGGTVGGGLSGGALGLLAAALGSVTRNHSWGGLGPKRFGFDHEQMGMTAPLYSAAGAGAGALGGNLVGGYKGTQWGIGKHRKAEQERGEHAGKIRHGTKKDDDE